MQCQSEFGCPSCRVTLTLDAEAKMEQEQFIQGEIVSDNQKSFPVSDRIPIIKLAKNQKLKLEAYARLGRGKTTQNGSPFQCVPINISQK